MTLLGPGVCDDPRCAVPSKWEKLRTDFRLRYHLHPETATVQDPNCRVLRRSLPTLPPNRRPGHLKAREPVAERPAQAVAGAHSTCGRDSGDRADVQPACRAQARLLLYELLRSEGFAQQGVEDAGLIGRAKLSHSDMARLVTTREKLQTASMLLVGTAPSPSTFPCKL